MVWMAFPSENAVMNAFDWQPNTFRSSQVIPVGMSVIIVALARDGSDYSSAFTTVTAAPGLSVPLTFQPTTLADLETALEGL